jgi:hypothetical protein
MTSIHESKNISESVDSTKQKVDCMICTEEVSQRKMIKCPFCEFEACVDCVDRFLMGIDDDSPRCMNNSCKKIWSLEFLASNFNPSFYNKRYRDRRAQIAIEREKSLLPGTQGLVKQEKKRMKNIKKINNLLDENAMYKELINKNLEKIANLRPLTRVVKNIEQKVEKKVFTRACPVDDCRGFLSTSLKCGICSVFACKDCHMPKASKRDDNHMCDPDLVATVTLLANDTKPCPSCHTPIYKMYGCDQMYCTQCHTAFSWERGIIERGVIHNPHYYESQRAMNGGIAPRNAGDMYCGGIPAIWNVNDSLDYAGVKWELGTNAHILVGHMNNIELPRYPNRLGAQDNSKLRVDYLLNRINEKQWISKLKTHMKKQEKNSEFHMIIAMFTATLSDIFGNIVDGKYEYIVKNIASAYALRQYTNNEFRKIGIRYGNVYPIISRDFIFYPNLRSLKMETKKDVVTDAREFIDSDDEDY